MTAPVLVRADFLGRTALVTAAFGAKLARVAEAVRAAYTTAMLDLPAGSPKPTFAEWHNIRGVGGYREGAGYHGKGRAVDLNYSRNGYLVCRTVTARGVVYGGEAAGARLVDRHGKRVDVRRPFADACDRACIALDGKPADLSARKPGESTGAVWDRWDRTSRAVIAYLAPYYPAADDLDVGEADHLPGVDPASIPPQVAADYQALRVPMVVGAPAINPRTTRNPAKGLMDIPRAVFVACDVVGLRLGLCDFGAGSSTDVMHLDDAPRIPSGAVA